MEDQPSEERDPIAAPKVTRTFLSIQNLLIVSVASEGFLRGVCFHGHVGVTDNSYHHDAVFERRNTSHVVSFYERIA